LKLGGELTPAQQEICKRAKQGRDEMLAPMRSMMKSPNAGGSAGPLNPFDTGIVVQPHVREHPKIGRNDPCWCGSGTKYKRCHL